MSDPEPNPYANPAGPTAPLSPYEEKQWAVLTHVLSIFFGLVAALVFFLIYRDRGPFVRNHTVTEWNLQLTVTIVSVLGFAVAFGSFFVSIAAAGTSNAGAPPGLAIFFVGHFLVAVMRLIALIFGIRASMAAYRGHTYRYPIAIRFVKE